MIWRLRTMWSWKQQSFCTNSFKILKMSLQNWLQNFMSWVYFFTFSLIIFLKCAIYLEFVILYLFVYDVWFLQILQHMKSSGKEHSMPYQVISRCVITNSLLVYSILVAFCGKCWGIFLGWSGNSFNEPLISSHEVNLVALYVVIHILCDLTFCLFEWNFVCG